MHFSIPDTEELCDDIGSTFMVAYLGYSIHVNGVFHCTVRYRQLLNLHEQLKKEYGSSNLPSFPPKKILPLSPTQLEERRVMLEKYIQTIGQDSQLVSTDILNGFLLSAQQETSCEKSQQVPLDVYLMNGYKVSLNVLTTERSVQVLETQFESVILHYNLGDDGLRLVEVQSPGDVVGERRRRGEKLDNSGTLGDVGAKWGRPGVTVAVVGDGSSGGVLFGRRRDGT
uniref:PX domain-containing protein n=1 Tax=Timema genevievae TaxID=629358 RepID=A0A7R9PPC7_TIMGE|nr:unnamed protein product [Timema genevievae]